MSGRSALVFRRLDVRRTPGIETPFVIENLTAGINITYGPNASGKSTTALVLQMLLWNDLPDWSRASLAAQIDLDGSAWDVEVDAGVSRARQDGSEAASLPLDASDFRDRYVLTLHDLLQADNADFAGVILRESAGGYDVTAARDELGYRQRPTQPRGNIGRLNEARAKTQNARQTQDALLREQRDLDDLRGQYEQARESGARVALLERALVARQRQQELEVAKDTLAALPESIALLFGDELERLAELDARRLEYEQRARQHDTEIEAATAEIARSGLEGAELPAGSLAALKEQSRQLQELGGSLARAEDERNEQGLLRDRAARQLGQQIDEAQLRRLEAGGLRELVTLARQFEQTQAQLDAAEALRGWLGAPADYGDIERLQRGISQLNGWLRSSGAPATATSAPVAWVPLIVAAGLIALLALVAGIAGHPVLLGLILLAPAPLVLGWIFRPKPATTTSRASHFQDEYLRLGLSQPPGWTVEHVERLGEELGRQLHQQQLARVRAERWSDLEERWQQAAAAHAESERVWGEALTAQGLNEIASTELHTLAQQLDRWQEADTRFAAAEQRVMELDQRHAVLLDALNNSLAAVGYAPSEAHAPIMGYVDNLDERLQQLESARIKRRNAESARDQTAPELARIAAERAAIFKDLDLDEGDERRLADWLEQRDAYLHARKTVEEADVTARQALIELGDERQLAERPAAALEAELETRRLDAAQAEELHRRIVEIETHVADAKRERNLEQALVDEELARDTLRSNRDEGYRLAAGWSLAEHVRQQTRDNDRPQVFHRARDLFVRMTQGRYLLEFDDDPEPAFRALDTTTNINHSLSELSSATRVQLLMAVRIAFVEEMEHGPKLPLILDETLGNADEHRAEAIIRAVCEISRSGRQVFYFTAQHDEVGKWRRMLAEQDDLDYGVISLAEVRQLAESEQRSALEELPLPAPSVAAPNGSSHRAYRELLGVPLIDPRNDVESVHLWYLVRDVDQLHRLLTHGISTWGQLKTLMAYGGAEFIEYEVFEVAQARADVVAAGISARRVGHGRPVDRAAVLDSGAFTETFVERVIEQADRARGDAEALLRRLDSGAVPRMRTDYVESFRSYLSDAGYLDPEEPLDTGEIRARVVGSVSPALAAGLIQPEHIDLLLGFFVPDAD